MGTYDLCKNAHIYSPGPMDTHYCVVSRDKAGVCVPTACTAEDLANPAIAMPILNLGMQSIQGLPMDCVIDPYLTARCAFMRQGWEYFQSLYNIIVMLGKKGPMNAGGFSCDPQGVTPDGLSYVVMALMVVLTAACLGGAAWKHCQKSFNDEVDRQERAVAATGTTTTATTAASPQKAPVVPKTPGGTPEFQEISLEETKSPGKSKGGATTTTTTTAVAVSTTPRQPAWRFPSPPPALAAFSFVDNYNELFTLKGRVGEFACFDAMRAISAAWVVFYHVLLWQVFWVQNPEYLVPPMGLMSKWWTTPFFNYSGTLSVDTFFFISGFLASYLLLTKLDKEEGKGESKPAYKWVPVMYLHRYLRVSPAYFFSFLIHWKIAPLLADGPRAQDMWRYNNAPCDKYWWTHVLYINNVYPWWNQRYGEVCYGHSWYLANDMQYFLMVPIFVMLYRSGGKRGKMLGAVAVIASVMINIISSLALAVQYEWSPLAWDGVEGDRYREQAFPRPWIRGASYMIGILVSFVWYEKKTRFPDYKFTNNQAWGMWWGSMFLLALAMYGPYSGSNGIHPCQLPIGDVNTCGSGWSRSDKAAVIAFLRPTWTIGVALMCMLCWNNQGGLIQSFLTFKFWVPLSALSYTIYLVHYTVLTFWTSQRTLRVRWSMFDFVNLFFGLTAISCGLAVMVVFLVERPFMKIQKYYLEGGNKKKVVKAAPAMATPPAPAKVVS